MMLTLPSAVDGEPQSQSREDGAEHHLWGAPEANTAGDGTAEPVGTQDQRPVHDETDEIEDCSEQQDLRRDMACLGLHELRKQGEREKRHLWVQDVGEQALPEHRPERQRGASVDTEKADPGARKAVQARCSR